MAIPINSYKGNSKYSFDISFLIPKKDDKKVVTASDKEANMLMKIWNNGKKLEDNKFSLSNSLVSQREFSDLKYRGLITGTIENCELTSRAKKVITVMTLGENNSFLKGKVEKSYTEILASNSKKNKSGYRMPKTANKNLVKQCKIKDGDKSIILTHEEWLKMGEQNKWKK